MLDAGEGEGCEEEAAELEDVGHEGVEGADVGDGVGRGGCWRRGRTSARWFAELAGDGEREDDEDDGEDDEEQDEDEGAPAGAKAEAAEEEGGRARTGVGGKARGESAGASGPWVGILWKGFGWSDGDVPDDTRRESDDSVAGQICCGGTEKARGPERT